MPRASAPTGSSSYAMLDEARDCLTRAKECFEEAALCDDLADILAWTRRGQAFYDAAEAVRKKIEESLSFRELRRTQAPH